MTQRQRVLHICAENDTFFPYFRSLKDHVNSRPYPFSLRQLMLGSNSCDTLATLQQHFKQKKYELVLVSLELALAPLLRERHHGKVVAYTYSLRFPDIDSSYDGVINLLYLKDFSDSLTRRISQYLCDSRS